MSENVRQLPRARDINDHAREGTLPADPTKHATPINRRAWAVHVKEELARAVREEIRACGLLNDYQPGYPLPSDIEAEITINGALASGEVSIGELYDLSSDDFYDRGQRYFFARFEAASAAGMSLTKELLVVSATSEGMSPDALAPDIEWLFSRPVCYPDDARRAARNIIECSRRRRWIGALQKIDVSMRLGERSYSQAVAALEKLVATAKAVGS